VGGQHHAPAALPPGKTWYPLYRRLGGPQGRSGRVRKISPPTGIRFPDLPVSIPTELPGPFFFFTIDSINFGDECEIKLILLALGQAMLFNTISLLNPLAPEFFF
jgi:hypothetical protein